LRPAKPPGFDHVKMPKPPEGNYRFFRKTQLISKKNPSEYKNENVDFLGFFTIVHTANEARKEAQTQ